MARSAKRPSRSKQAAAEPLIYRGFGAVSAWVQENPTLVGGTTAFLVAMAFVSANAVWYQPHAHTAPLFATRSFETFATLPAPEPEPRTTIRLARPEMPVPSARPVVAADAATQRVQSILKDLGYYAGTVDGIPGPNTTAAVSAYQRKMGLSVSGRIDDLLLKELGAGDVTGSIEPQAEPVSIERIQAGLRAFGKLDVDIDGKAGRKTRDGIREFQALFGLDATGEPGQDVLERMILEGFLPAPAPQG